VIFNWLLLQTQNLLPRKQIISYPESKLFPTQKANYFLPNSEAFYETLFIRLPTLIRQYDIPKDWKDK
jgi:hypothetical protein